MSLNDTPQSERLTIVVIGACNSGKSSVINMLADQEVSLVSNIAGTTTDPVKKAIELPEVGAALLVDTAGFDDESILGEERIALTKKALSSADLVLLLIGENNKLEYEWEVELISLSKPYIKVANNKGLRQIDCDGAINVDALQK
ncbi:MAG: 50S ribosome-binding GTPase, partial [Muribaculaceae bacterium]|nr:50S ribosome-binding GTPase [Muribaculaceae bacterium]